MLYSISYIIIAIIEKRMYKKLNRIIENLLVRVEVEEEKSLTVPVYIFVCFLIKINDSRNYFSNPHIT